MWTVSWEHTNNQNLNVLGIRIGEPSARCPAQPERGAGLRPQDALGWSAAGQVRLQLRMRGLQPLQSPGADQLLGVGRVLRFTHGSCDGGELGCGWAGAPPGDRRVEASGGVEWSREKLEV